MEKRTIQGEKLIDWINLNISPDIVIAANNGQATGYLLKRKTLSLVSKTFSVYEWNENYLKKMMNSFDVKHLILYLDKEMRPDSPLLMKLSHGFELKWLKIEERNSEVIIFKSLQNNINNQILSIND